MDIERAKWKSLCNEIEYILKSNGFRSNYLHGEPGVLKSLHSSIKGEKYCIACGQQVSKHFWMGNHRFCEECIGTGNVLLDYQKAFQDIERWMSDFYVLQGQYPVKVSLIDRGYTFGRAIRVKGRFREKCIYCKGFMRRDVIRENMIYAYVKLWIYERWRGKRERKKLKEKYSRKKLRLIPFWYMVLYMDLHGKGELAQTLSDRMGLSDIVGELGYNVQNDAGYDQRGWLKRRMEYHPLR